MSILMRAPSGRIKSPQFLPYNLWMIRLPWCLKVRCFGIISIRINDPRLLQSWCIKGTRWILLSKDKSFDKRFISFDVPWSEQSLIVDPRSRSSQMSAPQIFCTLVTRVQSLVICHVRNHLHSYVPLAGHLWGLKAKKTLDRRMS